MNYRLNDLYCCIQGEGCQTGQSMVLVRLQGCSVGCPWCDTKETWGVKPTDQVDILSQTLGTSSTWATVGSKEIAAFARRVAPSVPWALVTGGEPAEQPLTDLVSSLRVQGFRVAIETSGTALGHVEAGFDWVTVSPKISMPGGKLVLDAAIEVADEVKYVIGTIDDITIFDDLLRRVSLKPSCVISLQPVSGNRKATELCVRTVKQRGWRLSVQVHKLLNER